MRFVIAALVLVGWAVPLNADVIVSFPGSAGHVVAGGDLETAGAALAVAGDEMLPGAALETTMRHSAAANGDVASAPDRIEVACDPQEGVTVGCTSEETLRGALSSFTLPAVVFVGLGAALFAASRFGHRRSRRRRRRSRRDRGHHRNASVGIRLQNAGELQQP